MTAILVFINFYVSRVVVFLFYVFYLFFIYEE